MVLRKLSVPMRPTIWMIVGQGPIALAVGAGRGCLDIFTLLYLFSPLSPSLWETVRYRLKYCLKGPLNPKQPTNQLAQSTTRHLPLAIKTATKMCTKQTCMHDYSKCKRNYNINDSIQSYKTSGL